MLAICKTKIRICVIAVPIINIVYIINGFILDIDILAFLSFIVIV